ncbi:MAG TPA: F0F1 ATP synthase subunit epsilon [Candidatus Saccharimonadales bacterium]|nr:F0F1 ATP synthase subunit epsilon [Candidatus Saccharimonadales bacterium]
MSEPVKVHEQKVIDERQPTAPAENEQQRALSDFSKKNTGKTSMRVHVYSPFRDYYDGLAVSLSAENATGPFDILPKHHNFISLLLPCEIVIRTVSEGERKIRISGGIMHVKADQVIVFLDV